MTDIDITTARPERKETPRVGVAATAWVILGSSGQWSDWSQWAVEVHTDEHSAKDRVVALTDAIREVMSAEPQTSHTDDDEYTPEYMAWLDRLTDIDGSADQYDQSRYTAVEVPFVSKSTAT